MSWDLNIKEEIVSIRKLLEEVVAKLSRPCEEEKATEKLKALERLKGKGLRFHGVGTSSNGLIEIDGALPALE
jgi:hypothetical protein